MPDRPLRFLGVGRHSLLQIVDVLENALNQFFAEEATEITYKHTELSLQAKQYNRAY